MSTQSLRFSNRQGLTLAALLDMPDEGQARGLAIFAHCFTCSKDIKAAFHISRALAGHGFSVLRFDFAGLGESEGDLADTSFTSNVSDLVAAARHLEQHHQQPDLLIGHSLGGAAVLAAASRIASVKAVVTIGAPSSPRHLLGHLTPHRRELESEGQAEIEIAGRRLLIRRRLLEDIESSELSSAIAGLGRPLLVLHSPTDETVGITNAAEIYQSTRHPKSFVSLDRADHLLSDRKDSRWAGHLIAAWAARYVEREA